MDMITDRECAKIIGQLETDGATLAPIHEGVEAYIDSKKVFEAHDDGCGFWDVVLMYESK